MTGRGAQPGFHRSGMLLLSLCSAMVALGVGAQQPVGPTNDPSDPRGARRYFGDTVLVNQDGEEMRFYSDLLAGKKVVINAFFTACDGVCPVIAGKLLTIQKWLGDRMETEVRLISISVDPSNDTPAELKKYAERLTAGPGWYFLGGDEESVRRALSRLGLAVEDREAHTNILILGDEATGRWQKIFGLASPQELVETIDSFLSDE